MADLFFFSLSHHPARPACVAHSPPGSTRCPHGQHLHHQPRHLAGRPEQVWAGKRARGVRPLVCIRFSFFALTPPLLPDHSTTSPGGRPSSAAATPTATWEDLRREVRRPGQGNDRAER